MSAACGRVTTIVALAACLFIPVAASAQAAGGSFERGRVEVAGGAGLLGGGVLGAQDGSLRANSRDPEPFRVFTTRTRFEPALLLDGRAGFALTSRYALEAGFSFARPELRTSIADDVEDAESLDVSERVDQYLIDGGLVVALDALRFGSLLPVASGGAGYVRQLHEGRTTVEEGRFLHVGFGVRRRFAAGGRGLVKGSGVRADVRLYVFDGGISVSDGVRTQGAVSASLFAVF
jgi:opacity protein-like surface antigen